MLCEKCGIREATVHYTEVVNGVKKEHYLCAQCAQEEGLIPGLSGLSGEDNPFVRFLSGLLGGSQQQADESSDKDSQITCPNCGMTFGEFTKIGKFGCPECYRTFGPLIENEFKKFQADSHHIGKKYGKSIENQQIEAVLGKDDVTADGQPENGSADGAADTAADAETKPQTGAAKTAEDAGQTPSIAEMEKQKEEAVKREDYMEAARLRDAIRKAREKNE